MGDQQRIRFGLGARLLVVLLAFGTIPVAAAVAIGFLASRTVITDQAEGALRELTRRQATHLATEITRQHLLLRTITGQLPARWWSRGQSATALSRTLRQSLPDDGVFDGLRLVTPEGRVAAGVALRDAVPHWPVRTPSTDWRSTGLAVHLHGGDVIAYVIGVAAGDSGWLEGHVRAEDFPRVLAIPDHAMTGVRSVILYGSGLAMYTSDSVAREIVRDAGAVLMHGDTLIRSQVAGGPFEVAAAPVSGAAWTYAAALPLEEAVAPLARLRNIATLGIAGLAALLVLVAALAARTIARPLRALAAGAQQFGRTGVYVPVEHAANDEVGLLVQSFDRMAGHLRASREELERLHAEEMQRAQQLATVGELASGVAHEIRNPLTGVLGALELAARRLPADDSSRPLLSEAERQLRRIERTTAQLLRYARPPELRQVVVDAAHLVERALEVVRVNAEAAGVRVVAQSPAAPAPLRVDPELMVQVLVNLMLNAIQAMTSDGALTVGVAADPARVTITVRDSGPGVPPEMRERIFRPFFTSKPEGTGLGLPISRQIVVRHGGTLECTDAPEGGAMFVISLPALNRERER